MTEEQAKIILAYADNDMVIKRAGEQVCLHPTGVNYHLKKIRKQTGWDPFKFYDLCYLVLIARSVLGGNRE